MMAASLSPGNKFFNPRNSFTRAVFLTVFCLVFFILTLRPTTERVYKFKQQFGYEDQQQQQQQQQPPKAAPPVEEVAPPAPVVPDCTIDAAHLQSLQQKFGLGDKIEYGRRYIHFIPQDIERKSITKIDEDLFPEDFDTIDLQSPPANITCLKALDVPVPKSPYPATVDASDFLFGVSTTYKRLVDPKTSPIHEWAHWLTDGKGNSNGGGLILRLVDASDEQLEETRKRLAALGMDVKVYHSNSSIEMAQRYLSLLPTLYNDVSRKNRKWLVMCDDDTFFPSMHALIRRLSQYNHRSDLYIGTLSEDVNNVQRHGSQAFGGAGVFFSTHLASVITKLYDQCSTPQKVQEANTGWGPQGDILLRKCIYENTEIRLTLLRDLHQLDIMGDPAGFYEAGLAPLSLHHFKGGMWTEAKPYEGAKVMHTCGEDCFLQRFLSNDDFIISNGYSIAYYPKGIQFDVNQMERTFNPAPDDYGWNLDFMLGPQRQSLTTTGRKVAWELQESTLRDDGSVLQSYIRKADDKRWTENGRPLFDKDGLLELVWVP
jgi:hypothetical protein